MISELDRFHGVVLRQIVVACETGVRIAVVDRAGRVDAFSVGKAAFQIKHSAKRLSPWQFTYLREHVQELQELHRHYNPLWVMLVCGTDGVVGLTIHELLSMLEITEGGAGSIRVSRSRNAMYRVSSGRGELPRAKPRGVQPFIAEVLLTSGGTMEAPQ